jgi:hypothetical protein
MGYTSNTKEFIARAILIHGDKYNYSKVNYVKRNTIVIITCKIHGDFPQTPNDHLQGCGCVKCKGVNEECALSALKLDIKTTADSLWI